MRILSRNLAFLSRWWTRLRRWITAPATWWWSYFLGGFVRYMRTVQSYRHSSKNLTWSIFSEILPVRFKLTNSNNRNGIFTKNPSCFWNHTHTNGEVGSGHTPENYIEPSIGPLKTSLPLLCIKWQAEERHNQQKNRHWLHSRFSILACATSYWLLR